MQPFFVLYMYATIMGVCPILYKNRFTWDENKHNHNKQKHRISFEEASTVFDDENVMMSPDFRHSYDEDRFIVIGMSRKSKVLMVCYCYRNYGSVIRIISARKATKGEETEYWRLYYG